MQELMIKRLHPKGVLPRRATEGSAGMDLYAVLDDPIELAPLAPVSISTGIAVALPSNDYAAFIYARSGLACRHGITLSNSVGIIDSDYRGEIKVSLVNLSQKPYTLMPGERIAQLIIQPVCRFEPVWTDLLDETVRGEGGFGSTGRL